MTYREPAVRSPILICATGKHLFAMNRTTGAHVWQRTFDDLGTVLRVAHHGDHVFVGLAQGLACVVEHTGEPIWEKRTLIPALTLLLDGDLLFVGGGGRIACFDLAGQQLWRDDLKGFGIEQVMLAVPGNVAQIDRD